MREGCECRVEVAAHEPVLTGGIACRNETRHQRAHRGSARNAHVSARKYSPKRVQRRADAGLGIAELVTHCARV